MYCGETAGMYYALLTQISVFQVSHVQGRRRQTRRRPFSGFETTHFKVTPLKSLSKPMRLDFRIQSDYLEIFAKQRLNPDRPCQLEKTRLADESRSIVPHGSPPNWDYWSLMQKMYFVHEVKL